MTVCTQTSFEFPVVNRRRVQASFTGGDVASDGGLVLLRQVDRRRQLTATLAKRLPDPRDPPKVTHPLVTLLRQRIYGLCQGYEDLNDRLRTDVALQPAVEQDDDLASASTLCRWENDANRQAAWLVHQWWVEQFIASHATPPAELVLDLDATDDPLHGQPEGAFFHGYYGQYCFLPLYVFCGERLLVRVSAAQQHRRGPARVGDRGVVGETAAAGVADGQDRGAGRQRVLSLAAAAVV